MFAGVEGTKGSKGLSDRARFVPTSRFFLQLKWLYHVDGMKDASPAAENEEQATGRA